MCLAISYLLISSWSCAAISNYVCIFFIFCFSLTLTLCLSPSHTHTHTHTHTLALSLSFSPSFSVSPHISTSPSPSHIISRTPIVPPLLLSLHSEAKRLSLSLETMDLVFQGTQELSMPTFKRKMMDLGFRYL